MKILIVTDTYPPNVNGAALATERMAKQLVKRGHTVSVVAPSTSFRHYKRTLGDITIYRLRSILIQKTQDFRISPQPLHMGEFKEIMREVKPDIIHINNPGFIAQTAITIGREFGVPLVGTSHFMPENLTHYLHLPDQLEKMVNTSIWKLYAKFYGRLNLIISPTQTAADILKRLKVGTKIEVISNGIDLHKFNKDNHGEYLKKTYNLPEKIMLLFVGRIDKEKNVDVLITAASIIKQAADFHIVLVGKGKEEQNLENLAKNLGLTHRITFTRYLPKNDLPNIYSIADIFVMPGIAELQSLVTMEAMATGLPVIGANAVALPHLIHNNENGFLFTPGDANDLAKKLLRLIQDKSLREQMGNKSLEIIKEHDINNVIVQVENAYKNVIEHYEPNPEKKHKSATDRKKILRGLKKLIPAQLLVIVASHLH